MFSLWKKNGAARPEMRVNTPQTKQPAYSGDKVITALFNAEFSRNFLNVINQNIIRNTSPGTRGKINLSMQKDLPRMEYYIEGKYISVPGNIDQSLANFYRRVNEDPSLLWLTQYIDSVSAFLHQGMFVDICESIPYWEDNQGERWEITMISLDPLRSKNAFDINRHGAIKVTAQSNVNNLILKNGDIILTDNQVSRLQMQVSLLMLKGGGGSCMAVNAQGMADKAVLTVSCQGKM